MSEWLKAVILGIVEGVTEFLPISSTGHLIVASSLLDFNNGLRVTFQIFIQIGAVVAVIAFYNAELRRQVRAVSRDRSVQRLWLALLVALIPTALIGFLARQSITALFSMPVVLASMIGGGIFMIVVEHLYRNDPRFNSQGSKAAADLDAITLRQAAIVGLAQVFSLLPGMSRSAVSIMGGLLGGMNRRTATQFSFFLAIPTLGGATVTELISALDEIRPGDLGLLALGAFVSAVVSWFAIRWLLRYVARHTFVSFGVYRVVVGTALLLLLLAGYLPDSP